MSSDSENGKRRSLRNVIRVIVIALVIGAIVKELRKPAGQRTWHGALFDFVPYDFRKPTTDKLKASLWNPGGPIVTPQVFGVGWTLNAGAVVQRIKAARNRATSVAA